MERPNVIRRPVHSLVWSHIPALFICLCLFWSSAQADEWHFSDVERTVAFGDVHGAYDALVATLQKAEVIDENLKWSGGKTHLVSTGDLLDRGAESRRVMDLMMRLEGEAELAGGRVHQLLGNHEVMNLNGDLRYVADEEYAAFIDMESPDDREFWYQRYRQGRPADSDESAVRWEFDQKAPPGFFGHRRAFGQDGYYGKWLLGKPFMIVINDVAFVHGGVPPLVAAEGLNGANGTLKKELQGFLGAATALRDEGVLNAIDRFREMPPILNRKAEAGQIEDKATATAQSLLEFGGSALHGPAGPTWYRGTAACSQLIEGDALTAGLDRIGATRVVIGHTTTITRQVQQRMNGRVIEIDTGMLRENYGGSGNALVIEHGETKVVNQDSETDLVPVTHPLRVGHEAVAIEEAALADILANGQIIEVAAVGAGWELVRVGSGDQTVLAVFHELPEDSNSVPELAAFKLDRLLHLGMVPVTVRREINSREGTLQFVPAVTLTERERVAAKRGLGAACSTGKQTSAMFVFDALIQNSGRTPSSMLFDPDDWLLILVDHDQAFGPEPELPAVSANIEPVVGDQWRTALRRINDDVLRRELGDVLDKERLLALGKRRDALIMQGD